MTFLEAALEILKRERKPLHFKELTEKAISRKLLTFVGRTPEVTMQTQLTNMVKKQPGNPFIRAKPGVFGLLRYPEAPPEPEPVADTVAPSPSKAGDTPRETAEGRQSRRRRGGRSRRRGERPMAPEGLPAGRGKTPSAGALSHPDGEPSMPDLTDEADETEEPTVGGLSAEARTAALAESGVLSGSPDEEDDQDEDEDEDEELQASSGPSDSSPPLEMGALPAQEIDQQGEDTLKGEVPSESVPLEENRATPPSTGTAAEPRAGGHPERSQDSHHQGVRRVMTPVDAAIEVLRGQAPGRGMHVRQIADSAIRRRLIHGEPNEAWRVMRAALATESKERLRGGVRPRVRPAGSGLFALARRPPDADLEKAEFVFGEARRALRERTLAALEQRLGDLSPAAFEAVARVLLQREGFGPATFVKRVEGTIYVEALRGRGFRPSKCLIALRHGMAAAGRRALGELRAGIRARNQDEGLIVFAGRLADDAIAEWKQPGPPVEVVDGPAMAETCVRHGLGVISAPLTVEFVDADFFAELAEG